MIFLKVVYFSLGNVLDKGLNPKSIHYIFVVIFFMVKKWGETGEFGAEVGEVDNYILGHFSILTFAEIGLFLFKMHDNG